LAFLLLNWQPKRDNGGAYPSCVGQEKRCYKIVIAIRSPREKYFAELIAPFAGKVLPKYSTKKQRPSHKQSAANSNEMLIPPHLEP